MYILKNAVRNIVRSIGRNCLIGIIVVVIATSACVALSIRESANKAREESLALLDITAQLNIDQKYAMENVSQTSDIAAMQEEMKELMSSIETLTLDELMEYAESDYVKDFYYTVSATLNGVEDGLAPVDTTGIANSENGSSAASPMPGAMQQPPDPMTQMGTQGDFMIVGYNCDAAMEEFFDGTYEIPEGKEYGTLFDEGTDEYDCVITDELATFNSISVGDTIELVNPNNEEEIIELNVVGIYESNETTDSMIYSTSADPANKILMSYNALNDIIETSEENATTEEDDEYSNEIRSIISGTFVFSNIENYDAFEVEIYERGLGEMYILTSNDVASYESSLLPLDNLKSYATIFLFVILIIGAIILVVINMFNIRERKYEVGVMTAIGMKKPKVAVQFILELFIVTIVSILIGTAIGAAISTPLTNSLLESQIEQQQESSQGNMGRPTLVKGGAAVSDVEYVSNVGYSVDFSVLLSMILIGIFLTIISSAIAVLFIMRYEPLKILTNRD